MPRMQQTATQHRNDILSVFFVEDADATAHNAERNDISQNNGKPVCESAVSRLFNVV